MDHFNVRQRLEKEETSLCYVDVSKQTQPRKSLKTPYLLLDDCKSLHNLQKHTWMHACKKKHRYFYQLLHISVNNINQQLHSPINIFSKRLLPEDPNATIPAARAHTHTQSPDHFILRHWDMNKAEIFVPSRFEKAAHRHPKLHVDPTCFLFKGAYLHTQTTVCRNPQECIPAANTTENSFYQLHLD